MRLHIRAACVSSILGFAALFLAACGPQTAAPPAFRPPSPEQQFSALERRYVIFVLERYPVVSTYLGGSEFDRTLADNDGKLRDYSADSLKDEDTHLGELREQFTALDPNELSPRRRIDRNVAVAEIDFQDAWQRSLISAVTVSSNRAQAELVLQSVEREAASQLGAALVNTTTEWIE